MRPAIDRHVDITPLLMGSFDPSQFPRRINLGCGHDYRDGYINVDLNAFHNPDLVCDVRDLSLLPSAYYFEIVAQDVLEHLPRTATASALKEWNRLLEMSGSLHLRVPSFEGLAELFARNRTFAKHKELMQCLFGTQAYTGDFHFTSFTKVLLDGYLAQTGFELKELAMRDEWLYEATAIKVALAGPSLHVQKARLLKIDDDAQFLTETYALLLHRQPDSDGLAFFLEGLVSAQLTREQVLGMIEGSSEFRSVQADNSEGSP